LTSEKKIKNVHFDIITQLNPLNKLAGGYQIPHEMYQNDWFKTALKTLKKKKNPPASGVAPTCLFS
jgi:hypothetical protein